MLLIIQLANGQRENIEIQYSDTIAQLKQAIANRLETDPARYRLIFAGRQLDDDTQAIADYNIPKESIIHLIVKAEPEKPPAPAPEPEKKAVIIEVPRPVWSPEVPKTTSLSATHELQIIVIEARNLMAGDMNGFSDPYVVVQAGSQTKKTDALKKTLNPVWNQDMKLKISLKDELVFSVWDKDTFTADDFLGQVRFSLSQPLPFDSWVALGPRKDHKKDKIKSGELHLQMIWTEDVHRKQFMDEEEKAHKQRGSDASVKKEKNLFPEQ